MPLVGEEDHGGNCFGSVRMWGHLPARASAAERVAAVRRASKEDEKGKDAGRTTKPSRSSEVRDVR